MSGISPVSKWNFMLDRFLTSSYRQDVRPICHSRKRHPHSRLRYHYPGSIPKSTMSKNMRWRKNYICRPCTHRRQRSGKIRAVG